MMTDSEAAVQTMRPIVWPTTSQLTGGDRWDHLLARCAVNRDGHRVRPGLYALGAPSSEDPVFVTANYTLSFDALRSALEGVDGYILVLDTRGINVWCAAGKGTFGTDELVQRIDATELKETVAHRELILPQLGAPGIAAHEVKRCSGFKVEYGPVRASDLPAYLANRQASVEMRRVRFDLRDRATLIPVEVVHALWPMLIAAVVLALVGGLMAAAGAIAAILAGVVLFPILLPWLPTHELTTKGFILGGLVAAPFALAALLGSSGGPQWQQAGKALAYLLAMPPATAYLALNFTGSTTFTSRTGVRREIYRYVPAMAAMFGAGVLLTVILVVTNLIGGR